METFTYHPVAHLTPEEGAFSAKLIEYSIDAIIAFDLDNNILAWNRTADLKYKKNKEEVIGKSLYEAIPSMEADEETKSAIALARKNITSFVPSSTSYFHRYHSENHFIPLKDATGNVTGIMNLMHDVGHRVKAELKLQHLNEELQKKIIELELTSTELSNFTYITSNKVKEPIRQIYTALEFLIKVEGQNLSNQGKASFRRMQASLNRMNLLLNDILSLAQISIMQKPDQDISLDFVLTKVIEDLKDKLEEKNARIDIESLCTIKGHEDYLRILFYNLIDNALKFNDNEIPVINIACKLVCLTDTSKFVFAEQEYYCISITDNGIGIAEWDIERIFIMFEKLNDKMYKGSGTGLTVSKKIMDAHKGFIKVSSEPAQGSLFQCYFPTYQ